MSASWPKVRLGDVLRYRKEFITIDDLVTYRRPRVQLHAQGIVLRDEVPGALIKTKHQQVCHVGEFLVAEIDAKVGGFGMVPESLEGAIVSGHYFLYVIDSAKLDRRFLGYFVRTPAFRDQVAAQGSTNYAAIRPTQVLGYEIPLPPLAEQRRVVARIDELAARIAEARSLRGQAIEETSAILPSARLFLLGAKPDESWLPLGAYVAEIQGGKSPATEGRPASEEEWGVLKVGAVSFGRFDENENKALPVSYPPIPDFEVGPGDFLMCRANTLELVGACTIVGKTRPKLMLSDKTFRFILRANDPILPEYLEQVLKSLALREQIERVASGTSTTMKNISKEKILALRVPCLPIEKQHEIVNELMVVQSEVASLEHHQSEAAAELDALLPSILNRAFIGDL